MIIRDVDRLVVVVAVDRRSPGGSRDGEERAAGAETEGDNETSALGRGRGGRLGLHGAV